ncbi:cell wall anchor protein [Rhizobium leguminosarum]|uniref:cell wall anchor protein n=1 Tax=Rhizobium leguminosarum TaxID=384 RepID=UPI003F94F28D
MRSAIALLAAAAFVTSCTPSVDDALQKNLPKVCSVLNTSHVAFVAIATSTGKISEKTMNKEAAAYEGVKTLCVDPGHVTLPTAIIQVTQAVIVVTAALKEARAVEVAEKVK